jgi:hypothetical protein
VEALTFPIHEPGPFSKLESAWVSTFALFASGGPDRVVTATSTVPEPGGEIAVIKLSLATVTDAACDAPNLTAVAVLKPLPAMVTTVPPLRLPRSGPIDDTPGADRRYAKTPLPRIAASSI